MPIHFFPRDRLFWFYHCSVLALGVAVLLTRATNVLGRWPLFEFAIVGGWLALFTFLVLFFRWQYKRWRLETRPIGWVIVGAIAYSGVAGAVNVALTLATVMSAFWAPFTARYPRFKPEGVWGLVKDITYIESSLNALLILAWCFTYIGITNARRARNAELNNLRLQNSLKEAQLASLASQLNPHFLFNSLNNIRFMMYEDARRADTMIVAFSEILRYSLDSGRRAKVRLGDELAIVRKYIDVVAAQFESRLQVDMNVDARLQDALVPPMVLHLLVENAIKHGVEHLQHGGRLSLDGRLDGPRDGPPGEQRLSLTVANDVPAAGGKAPAGLGIGLANVKNRLALLYGGAAALEVEQGGTRFTVRLDLPMELRP